MDIEALREAITLIRDMGGEAKEAFMWYLVVSHLPACVLGVVWTGIGGTVLFKLVSVLRHTVNMCSAGGRLRQACGVSASWSDRDLTKACEVLREHYKR